MTILTASEFQFHKGAIKTVTGRDSKASGALFQFHKGAIKTCRGFFVA